MDLPHIVSFLFPRILHISFTCLICHKRMASVDGNHLCKRFLGQSALGIEQGTEFAHASGFPSLAGRTRHKSPRQIFTDKPTEHFLRTKFHKRTHSVGMPHTCQALRKTHGIFIKIGNKAADFLLLRGIGLAFADTEHRNARRMHGKHIQTQKRMLT